MYLLLFSYTRWIHMFYVQNYIKTIKEWYQIKIGEKVWCGIICRHQWEYNSDGTEKLSEFLLWTDLHNFDLHNLNSNISPILTNTGCIWFWVYTLPRPVTWVSQPIAKNHLTSTMHPPIHPTCIECANSYVPSFQHHLSIMPSTYKLQTSDFLKDDQSLEYSRNV